MTEILIALIIFIGGSYLGFTNGYETGQKDVISGKAICWEEITTSTNETQWVHYNECITNEEK